MDCYYHPGRESTSTCNVCGKPLCPECSVNIAGKTYCKDCLEKIIGMNDNNASVAPTPSPNSISDTLQGMESQYNEYDYYEKETPYSEEPQTREQIIGDVFSKENEQPPSYDNSPYSLNNFEDPAYPQQSYNNPNINQNPYETPVPQYNEPPVQQNSIPQPKQEEYYQPPQEPQYNQYQAPEMDDGYIYPDHSYQPPENPNLSVENKYESYLDDLYFDEPEVPLSEQIAKDEEIYGSLTKNPYETQETIGVKEQYYEAPANEYQPYMPNGEYYQEEGFIKINNVQHNNPQGDYIQQAPQAPPAPKRGIRGKKSKKAKSNKNDDEMRPSTRSIHNIRNMEEEKEPYGAIDILLTIILVVLIIIVIFYIVYLFFLSSTYPTFLDAILGLKDPGTFFGNLLGK